MLVLGQKYANDANTAAKKNICLQCIGNKIQMMQETFIAAFILFYCRCVDSFILQQQY